MNAYLIEKKDLLDFLKGYSKKHPIIAPIKNEFEDFVLAPVKDVNEISFDYENTINSAKDYFLPQCENLFSFTRQGDSFNIQVIEEKEEFLIFGIRPCDTKAIELLDKFFEKNFKDNFYFARRKSSLIISLACSGLGEDCFCNATGSGPILNSGFDVQLIPLDGKFFLEIGSQDAETKLAPLLASLKPADEKVKQKVLNLKSQILESEPAFDLMKVYNNLKHEKIKQEIWQDIVSRCQSCGLCLFICPVCSCFTMLDRGWERIRQWDSCYFRGFTRLAGGMNPVKNEQEMIKRKYLHKLVQQTDEFGILGCIGCGRCIRCCVGNVNWLENILKMQ
jgi:ferredoxin